MTGLHTERDMTANSRWMPYHSPNTDTKSDKPSHGSVSHIPTTSRKQLTIHEARSDSQRYHELSSFIEEHGFKQHFQPGSTLLLHGEPVDAVYLIEMGTVRCCTVTDSGDRQIFAFPRKGQLIGISDLDRWHFTAEAVDHVVVKAVPRATLEQELAVNISLRQEIRAYVGGLLVDREMLLLKLLSATGPDRLYRFLEDFAASRPGNGYFVLPMCRRDIADHIGLSMESVSRAFSQLKRKGLIDLKSHDKYCISARCGCCRKRETRTIHADAA